MKIPPTKGGFRKPEKSEIPQSLSGIKKRIRDINRTLQKGARTATIKVECERKLRALEHELGEKLIDDQERKMSVKYHMVKHFERKKTTRRIKKLQKELENTKDDDDDANKKQLTLELEDYQLNLSYINNFPKTENYISLYPSENTENEHNQRIRQTIKDHVREVVATKSDFSEFFKSYRDKYRKKLIRQGKITDVRPDMADASNPADKDTEKEPDAFLE